MELLRIIIIIFYGRIRNDNPGQKLYPLLYFFILEIKHICMQLAAKPMGNWNLCKNIGIKSKSTMKLSL